MANYSFYDLLYPSEQFETILIKSEHLENLTPVQGIWGKILNFDLFCPTSRKLNIGWIYNHWLFCSLWSQEEFGMHYIFAILSYMTFDSGPRTGCGTAAIQNIDSWHPTNIIKPSNLVNSLSWINLLVSWPSNLFCIWYSCL